MSEQGNLALTRKVGQVITIGSDINVTVVSIDRDRETVKLAIRAPKDIPIHRAERLMKQPETQI